MLIANAVFKSLFLADALWPCNAYMRRQSKRWPNFQFFLPSKNFLRIEQLVENLAGKIVKILLTEKILSKTAGLFSNLTVNMPHIFQI